MPEKIMNKTEAIKLLTTDVAAWNEYREQHREWRPDLRGADLVGADLLSSDLRGSDLRGSNLRHADLRGADLRYADIGNANLRCADLWGANLGGAKMTRSQVQPWFGTPDWQDEA